MQTNANGEVIEDVIEGSEGSPNPSGEKSYHLSHPADAVFRISEEPVEDGHG